MFVRPRLANNEFRFMPDGVPSEARLQHVHRLVVRWGDMDAMGHVNNACYFTYFEQVRGAWMQETGLPITTDEAGWVVARNACDYKRPVAYPATLEIRLFTGQLGAASLPTFYEVREDGDDALCARGEATLVLVSRETGRPTRLSDELRAALS
jgi:acyl-CoA thioester hydrolase